MITQRMKILFLIREFSTRGALEADFAEVGITLIDLVKASRWDTGLTGNFCSRHPPLRSASPSSLMAPRRKGCPTGGRIAS